jgi:hypothetical protein
MNYPGRIIAGAGHRDKIRDLPRLTSLYGGAQSDWVKKSTQKYFPVDLFGSRLPKVFLQGDNPGWHSQIISCHWYENIKTRTRYEMKIKILEKD